MAIIRDIVVVGAALGGVTAIAKLAATWPAELPATVLVALATPEQPPEMVLQILKTYAPVAVAYAVHGDTVKSRRIYLSPPGSHMFVGSGGVLYLDKGNAYDTSRPSINRLFAAAAMVYGPRVIGIVMSGDTKDGAQGMRDIADAGGVGIVQEPDDATASRMPENVIRNDHPRYIAKAADIAALVKMLMLNGQASDFAG